MSYIIESKKARLGGWLLVFVSYCMAQIQAGAVLA